LRKSKWAQYDEMCQRAKLVQSSHDMGGASTTKQPCHKMDFKV